MKQILCFGDSNTYGLIPGELERYDLNTRWTGILASKLGHKEYHVIEEGLCGRTTIFEDVLRNGRKGSDLLPIILETHKPLNLAVLMLGTNDCKSLYKSSPQLIGKGIKRLIDQIRNSDDKIKILLVSPILLSEGVGDEGYDVEFNENSVLVSKELKKVYNELASEEGCEFLAASDYAVASEIDREHLDEIGHKKLAEAIIKKIQTM